MCGRRKGGREGKEDWSVCVPNMTFSMVKSLYPPLFRLMENYKSLGCRVSKSGVKRKSGDKGTCDGVTSCTVVLRIPLEFPRVRKGRKK